MTTTAPTTTTTTAETGIIHVILWDTVTTLTCLGRHVSGTRVGTEACPSVVQEMPRPPARGRGTVGAWQNLTPPITIQVVPSVSQLQSLEYLSLRLGCQCLQVEASCPDTVVTVTSLAHCRACPRPPPHTTPPSTPPAPPSCPASPRYNTCPAWRARVRPPYS